MKRISTVFLAILLVVLVGTLHPAHVFAETGTEYVSEVKIFVGDYSAAEAEGYKLLKEGNDPVDLNQNAGGGFGSKGEKAVYLGYKTTYNSQEAITDLALMNMKGGYRTCDYEALMEAQMNGQIIPLVENFTAAIREYRENYTSPNELNQKRAQFVHDSLNKLTDDDCGGAGLGDLLLKETKYEMGDAAYNALSDEQKKEHADILTIIAQSNGNATLIMENMITRASDTNDNLWIDRFTEITYDDLIEATGMAPTDAAKEIAKLYDDDANELLSMWADFQEHLNNYENALEILEAAKDNDLSEEVEAADIDFETATEAEAEEAAEASVKIRYTAEELANASADVFCKEYLERIDYEDGTLLDFFMQPVEDIEDDIEVLYPIAASLSEGQRAGLEFVTLQDLVMFASTDEDGYQSVALDEFEEISIYLGVDRAIYEKGGIALTSDAIRNDVLMEETPEQSIALHVWSGISAGFALVGAGAFIASTVIKNSSDKIVNAYYTTVENLENTIRNNTVTYNNMNTCLARMEQKGLTELAQTQRQNMNAYAQSISKAEAKLARFYENNDISYIRKMESRSNLCSKLRVGAAIFTVVMVAVTAVLVYYDYQQMKEYYNVEFTPIPRYIIEEKDLIGYNKKGEKIVLKNQSAYYKLAECNRSANDEFYSVLGTGADLNGDVGKQWLALYTVKKDLMHPILASSLKVVVGSTEVPPGYTTGIHMFGSDAAFNLNSSLYDWSNDAPSVYVYFRTDDTTVKTPGSIFSGGTVALSGGAGMALGAVVTALAMKKKKEDPDAD